MSFSHFVYLAINYFKATLAECVALIIVLCTIPIDLTRQEIPSSQKGTTPILLIHGYMHNSSAWIYLRKRLQKAGLGPIYTINLGSPYHTIEEYAERVKEKAKIISRQTGQSELIIVGHSMGGLVSSYYATQLAPKNTVKTVITLGSPLKGTKLAPIGIGPCATQMRYKSDFTKRLSQIMEDAEDLKFFHIWSATDLIIRPPRSAHLYHQNSMNEKIESLGHVSFLYSPKIANKLIKYLKTTSAQQS